MTEQTIEQRLDDIQKFFEMLDDKFDRHYHAGVGEGETPVVDVPMLPPPRIKRRSRKRVLYSRKTPFTNHTIKEVARVAEEMHRGSVAAGSPPDRVWEAVATTTLDVALSLLEIQQGEHVDISPKNADLVNYVSFQLAAKDAHPTELAVTAIKAIAAFRRQEVG